MDPSLETTKQYPFNIHSTKIWQELQTLADDNDLAATQVPELGYTLGKKGWNPQPVVEKEKARRKERLERMRQFEEKRQAREAQKTGVKTDSSTTTPTVHSKGRNERIQRLREHEAQLGDRIMSNDRKRNGMKTAQVTVPVNPKQQDDLVTVATKNGRIDSVLAIISSQIKGFVTTQGTVSASRISLLQEETPIQLVLEKLCTDNPWQWWEDSAGNFVLIDPETYKNSCQNTEKNDVKFAFPHQVAPPPRLTPMPDKNSPPVTVATSDGRLGSVCEILSKQTNLTFTLHGTVNGENRVTVLAQNQPLEVVLEIICSPKNWVWWKDSEMSYAMSDQVYYQENIQQK